MDELPTLPSGVNITTFVHIIGNNPIESMGFLPHWINHYTWSIGSKTARYHLSDIIVHGHKIADAYTSRHMNRINAMYRSVINKKSHEIKLNRRFDIVAVVALNDIERVKDGLVTVLDSRNSIEWGGMIRSSLSKDHHSNGLWSIDDSLYVGSSADIDTMSRLALSYNDNTLWKMTNTVDLDPAYRTANLGALLWKWASIRNLAIGGLNV